MIRNKTEMYELLARGAFGNTFRIWDSAEEFGRAVDDGFDGLVGVRCVGPPGLPYHHHKTYEEAVEIGQRLELEHHCQVRYYEASPDEFLVIQGEFSWPWAPMLEWTTARTHMRAAFARERRVAYGPHALLVLQRALSPESYEDLVWLARHYESAVVEFSAYEIFVGDQELFPGRNHVCWEVRNY